MAIPGTVDLDAIAEEEIATSCKGGVPCFVCHHPDRAWIERKREEGLSVPILTRILLKAGFADVTFHKLKGHFTNHV